MAKVIRIGELPSASTLTNEDLFVINSFIEDRTYSITWADLIGNIKEISQPVIFSRGSVTQPSVAFVDFNAGFYSPSPGNLGVTTNGTRRMLVDGDGNIILGTSCTEGAVVFHSPTTYECDVTFEKNVQIDGDLNVTGNIDVTGEIDLIGNIGIEIEGDLVVTGNAVIGDPSSGCAGSFEVYSETTYYCDTYFEQTLQVDKNITVNDTTTTGELSVLGTTNLQGAVTINDDVSVNGQITIDASAGDLNVTRNLNVGGVLTGDGSGITNLNVPGSLSFKGAIDLTVTAPPQPQTGDLYITEDGPGTVNFSFIGIAGDTFQNNQFVFYTVDNEWVLGSVQDAAGFVTLSSAQTITGEKTYTQVLHALGGINATGQAIVAANLTLSGKGVSASTVSTDLDATLTTKDYVDDRSINSIADFPLTLGNYITGDPVSLYDGSVAVTANVDATPLNTPNFIVARDENGDFTANVITADLNGRANVSKKLDVTVDDNGVIPTYVTFVRDAVPTSGDVAEAEDVYVDSGLSYLPSTNTLTTSTVVADITGDITGNTDTATALETPRTLWGQTFDGTANVTGDMVDVGNITPIATSTYDIGAADNVWANIYADTFYGYLNGSSLVADRTQQKLTAGLHILSTNGVTEFDGSAATTWYIDTDDQNTPSKIVVRDLDGSFSSNVITANEFVGPLTGYVTGDVSGDAGSCRGNSATATALETARTLWSQTFDGTADITGDILNTGNIVPETGSTYDIGELTIPYANLYVDTIFGNIVGNAATADKVNNQLTRGQYLSGGDINFDGSAPSTWNIDATPNNVPNYIVARDINGDFSANIITANEFVGDLTGDVTGNVSGSSGTCRGNAATATRLETPRTLWGQTFDGMADVVGSLENTGNITPDVTNTHAIGSPTLQYSQVWAGTFHGDLDGTADIANRVANPLTRGAYITGNIPSFDGSVEGTWDIDATPENVGDKVVARDPSGNFSAGTITAVELVGNVTGNVTGNVSGSSGSSTGNAATATALQTPRDIEVKVSGATTGSGSALFDGTSNIQIVVPTEGIVDLAALTPLPA